MWFNGMKVEVAFCADDGGGSGNECLGGLVGGGKWQSASFEAYNGV
jgi:hypothetical protein